MPVAPLFCNSCILTAAPLSLSSWPFCGRLVSFDHHNPIVSGRIGAFLGQLWRPICEESISFEVWKAGERSDQERRTLPALYCVTGMYVSVVSLGDWCWWLYLYVGYAFCRFCLYKRFDES